MRCLKGVIIDEKSKLVLVKLISSGSRFWIHASPTSRVQRPVLVAWDYVRHEPHAIYTEDDWNTVLGYRESESEIGVFSIPSFVEVEDDEDIVFEADESSASPIDFWWAEEGSEDGDGVDGDFSNPLSDGTEDGVSEDHHNYY
jgi:hypothetical protein